MEPKFEQIHADANSAFRIAEFRCDSFSYEHPWHYHPEYELTYIRRGEGSRFVGDSIEPFVSGDLALIGPDLPHCWLENKGEQAFQTPELIVLQFLPEKLGEVFLNLPELAEIKQLLQRSSRGLVFSADASQAIATKMLALVQSSGALRLSTFLSLLHDLSQLDAHELVSTDYTPDKDLNFSSRDRIEQIHHYVLENIEAGISQSDAASLVGLSPSAFSRFFKQATGQTFVSFVNAIRVHRACEFLLGTDLSITEISFECGFQNISNFNRQFLAVKGVNPTTYRLKREALNTFSEQPEHDDRFESGST